MNSPKFPSETIVSLPSWVADFVDRDKKYRTLEERMELAISLARENVLKNTGGPFGAAIFESKSGHLLSVGMNSVFRLNNSTLHGEIVAFMMAQQLLKSYSLSAAGLPSLELVSTCEPCAMCLGAILWSGVKRVICGAAREDATRLGFEEGPVFPESYRYLEDRGVEFVRNVLRAEAHAVMELYRQKKGLIYNA
jgi:tRNA(Arg) A34 adenosine deaminase TadA